jgi:hypothetical protein
MASDADVKPSVHIIVLFLLPLSLHGDILKKSCG